MSISTCVSCCPPALGVVGYSRSEFAAAPATTCSEERSAFMKTTKRATHTVSAILATVCLSACAGAEHVEADDSAEVAQAVSAQFACPGGYVCLYEQSGFIASHEIVEHMYYDFGYHSLNGESGVHYVFNHQASSFARLCSSLSQCGRAITPGEVVKDNLSSYRYILLTTDRGW